MDSPKRKTFKWEKISFIETIQVKDGVSCDVYSFKDDISKDVAIISVDTGSKTPLQKILQWDETIEWYISWHWELTIDTTTYTFPGSKKTEINVKVGEKMQWKSVKDLVFYELCTPPYKDWRYQNIDE